MEAVARFNGALFDAPSNKISFPSASNINAVTRLPSDLRISSFRRCNLSIRPRKSSGCEFSDNGHLQYYVPTRCGGKKKEAVKEKNAEKETIKKRLKYLKGLSRNMLMFPEMGFVGSGADGLACTDNMRKTISQATEILLAQLKQVKAEQKMQKRKRNEEKQKLKAAQMKTRTEINESSSSSSSSESSDSECEEVVVNMSRLRTSNPAEPPRPQEEPQTTTIQAIQSEAPVNLAEKNPHKKKVQLQESCPCQSQSTSEQQCCSSGSSSSNSNSGGGALRAERIDVCVGGKCRKMGGAAVLEEFKRRVGVESSVVGCKCMGKCRNGPNVRVHKSSDEEEKGVAGNPLYIGVGLEDVGAIVSQFFGEKKNDLGLMAT